jgi:hypothetical protein
MHWEFSLYPAEFAGAGRFLRRTSASLEEFCSFRVGFPNWIAALTRCANEDVAVLTLQPIGPIWIMTQVAMFSLAEIEPKRRSMVDDPVLTGHSRSHMICVASTRR